MFAPLALVVLRFLQGVGLGGEWGGAALIAVENAPHGKRAWYGMFPQLGRRSASSLRPAFFWRCWWDSARPPLSPGVRVPFLVSAVLVAIGLYVRVSLEETPAFKALDQDKARPCR